MKSAHPRDAVLLLGLAALILLSGCSAATPESSSSDSDSDADSDSETSEEAETPAPAAQTACPEGFVDAYRAAIAPLYGPEFEFHEATVEEFTPAFLSTYLDGGCAVFVSGINTAFNFPVETYTAFSADASVIPAITASLEDEGFAPLDPANTGSYRDSSGAAAGYLEIGGPNTTDGWDVLQTYYPGGVVFW